MSSFSPASHWQRGCLSLAVATATSVGALLWLTDPWRNRTRERLDAIYDRLAAEGPPFPKHAVLPDESSFRTSEDGTRFEVSYPVRSDTFTRQYPAGEWEWRGSGYPGPSEPPLEGAGAADSSSDG